MTRPQALPRRPVPQSYPPPQVGARAARDVGPTRPSGVGMTAGAIQDAEWTEVGNGSKGRGIGGILWDSSKWLMREAVMPALYKMIPHGAQEIANALFTGNPYWPGGETGQPVPMAEEAFPTPAGLPRVVPDPELAMGTESGAVMPLLTLCLGLLLALTLGVIAARQRFSAALVWVVTTPVVIAVAWLTTDVVVRLLPNLM